MKKLFNALILTISLSSYFCYSQHELPNIIPPSPEAAQLGKYVESPVSYYNGTANISIPLFEINVDGVTVPIGLSYHSKGIQVGEIASRVGMGWTLNSGGAITRQIRGKADDYSVNGAGYLSNDFTESFTSDFYIRQDLLGSSMTGLDEISKDMDPDVFHFNFLGYSGKFIIDHVSMNPIIQKYEDFDISYTLEEYTNKLKSFTITDTKGVKYLFGNYEDKAQLIKNYSVVNQSMSWANNEIYKDVNTWYLYRIITPNHKNIDFNYEAEYVMYYQVNGNEQVGNVNTLRFTENTMRQHQLSQITYDNGYIIFEKRTTEREDLNNGYALWKVKQFNNLNNMIKSYVFNQSYRTCQDDNNQYYWLKANDNFAKKRLFLESIDEYGSQGEIGEKHTYSFEYNPILLPNRHSTSHDNWGYYNGKQNGELLSIAEYSSVNRQVDIEKSEAGMLKKITYPTGGYTEFEYEHNRVKTPDFYSQIAIPGGNNPTNLTVMANLFKYIGIWDGRAYVDTLSVGGTGYQTYFYDVSFTSNTSYPCSGGLSPNCKYEVKITSLSGNTVYYEIPLGTGSFSLARGIDYKVVVKPRGTHHPGVFYPDEDFFVIIRTNLEEIDSSEELLAGGKRIKKIIKKEGEQVLLTKEFRYTDANGKTTGRLFSIPNYFHLHKNYGNAVAVTGGLYKQATPMSSVGGGQLGYQQITETVIGPVNIGKTVYTFTVFPDTGEYYKFPYHFPTDMEWTRGLPLEVNYYKFENNNYSLVKKTKNKYRFRRSWNSPDIYDLQEYDPMDEVDVTTDYFITKFKYSYPIYRFGNYVDITDLTNFQPTNPNIYRTAYFIGGTVDVAESVETDYLNGQEVKVTHNFTFDSTHHNFLTKKQTIVSDGIVETRYQYPWDVTSSGDVYQKMALRNIIDVPITTEVYRNSTKLSEQKIEYFEFNFPSTNDKLLLPNYIKTSKGSNSLENRIEYLQYDDVGNPLEVKQTNGTHIVYIWGYNKTMPIAKVENATYSQVSSYVSNLQTLSNGTNESGLISALNTLRTNLPNALVTTYTYKPLVGVSSITDPRGYKTTYHYDSFGRLEFVKDHAGNIVQETKYNYQN